MICSSSSYRFLTLALVGLGLSFVDGCGNDDDASASAESDYTASCQGSSCATLKGPKDVLARGLATVGDELFWISKGKTLAPDGFRTIDELKHCTLPACTTISNLPLSIDGVALIPDKIVGSRNAIGGKLFIGGKKATTSSLDSEYHLLVSDGTNVVEPFAGKPIMKHRPWFGDDLGFTYSIKTSSEEQAWYCAWDGLTPVDCTRTSSAGDAFTPTRALGVGWRRDGNGGQVVYARPRSSGDWALDADSPAGSLLGVMAAGESYFAYSLYVESDGSHHTSYSRGGFDDSVHGTLHGSLRSWASDGKKIFAGSNGEGDVFGVPHAGEITTIDPLTGKNRVRASEQDVADMAVHGLNVYWSNVIGSDGDESLCEIRTIRKY